MIRDADQMMSAVMCQPLRADKDVMRCARAQLRHARPPCRCAIYAQIFYLLLRHASKERRLMRYFIDAHAYISAICH